MLLILALLCRVSFAVPADLSEAAFRQALLDMGTDLRLMNVAAHPDDEDGATLALYRQGYGLQTFAVIATRGEGGQNEIGPELYEELGVIRTKEMMAAARVTGAELLFLNLPEFGFSKSAEETFEIWGRDETVRRLVRVIRQAQPDVIITNHDTETGHGHHRAIGIALIEAFDAAADPNRFPELREEGLEPWQASRLFVRTWTAAPDVAAGINRLNPWRGQTYAEIAAEALQQHASQGMQGFIDRYLSGEATAHYRLVKEAPHPESASGLEAPGGEAAGLIAGLKDRVTPRDRELSTGGEQPDEASRDRVGLGPVLAAYATELARERDASPLALRRWRRANEAAVRALGIRLEATPLDPVVVPRQTVTLRVRLNIFDGGPYASGTARFSVAPRAWFPAIGSGPLLAEVYHDPTLGRAAPVEGTLDVALASEVPLTMPAADRLFRPHFMEPQLDALAVLRLKPQGAGGEEAMLEMRVPVRLEVAPPAELAFLDDRYLLRAGAADARLDVVLTDQTPEVEAAAVVLEASDGLVLSAARLDAELGGEGAQRVLPVQARLAEHAAPGDYRVSARLDGSEARAEALVRVVDVQVPEDAQVGVVQSYDDTLVDTLEMLGVAHEALELEDFTPERLDRFTTVLVDIRAYLVRPDLVANNQALLDYVERGGTVIVMYQKTFEWKPEYAPYPLRISTNRVTREDAPVTPLVPSHPLFHRPNVIEPADWEGWTQERGLYFADEWDPAYTALLRTVDPGEDIPPGGFLIAKHGEGTYVYTAFVWYRQLRALHPGALRLFANMLAL